MAVTGGIFPKWPPGKIVTFKANGAITEGRLVEIVGNMEVAQTTGVSRKVVGQALQTAGVAGDMISVQLFGYVARCRSNGATGAGDEVTSSTNGDVATLAAAAGATAGDINNARSVIGIALEAIAAGATGLVLIGKS